MPFVHLEMSDAILSLVESANVILWTELPPDSEPRELCVEVRVDQAVVHVTKAVKRSETMAWNELCPMCV